MSKHLNINKISRVSYKINFYINNYNDIILLTKSLNLKLTYNVNIYINLIIINV
jgi:hypothetical protein